MEKEDITIGDAFLVVPNASEYGVNGLVRIAEIEEAILLQEGKTVMEEKWMLK